MTKKQTVTLVVLAVFILLGVIAGIIARKEKSPGGGVAGLPQEGEGETAKTVPFADYYDPDIPEGATLTPTKNEAPASSNSELDSKSRFLNLSATEKGFLPEMITVRKGDTIYVDFTATDGSYDLDIPYLGTYFRKIEKGETKRLPFDVRTAGSFVFQCRDYCPRGGSIRGSLIVLP